MNMPRQPLQSKSSRIKSTLLKDEDGSIVWSQNYPVSEISDDILMSSSRGASIISALIPESDSNPLPDTVPIENNLAPSPSSVQQPTLSGNETTAPLLSFDGPSSTPDDDRASPQETGDDDDIYNPPESPNEDSDEYVEATTAKGKIKSKRIIETRRPTSKKTPRPKSKGEEPQRPSTRKQDSVREFNSNKPQVWPRKLGASVINEYLDEGAVPNSPVSISEKAPSPTKTKQRCPKPIFVQDKQEVSVAELKLSDNDSINSTPIPAAKSVGQLTSVNTKQAGSSQKKQQTRLTGQAKQAQPDKKGLLAKKRTLPSEQHTKKARQVNRTSPNDSEAATLKQHFVHQSLDENTTASMTLSPCDASSPSKTTPSDDKTLLRKNMEETTSFGLKKHSPIVYGRRARNSNRTWLAPEAPKHSALATKVNQVPDANYIEVPSDHPSRSNDIEGGELEAGAEVVIDTAPFDLDVASPNGSHAVVVENSSNKTAQLTQEMIPQNPRSRVQKRAHGYDDRVFAPSAKKRRIQQIQPSKRSHGNTGLEQRLVSDDVTLGEKCIPSSAEELSLPRPRSRPPSLHGFNPTKWLSKRAVPPSHKRRSEAVTSDPFTIGTNSHGDLNKNANRTVHGEILESEIISRMRLPSRSMAFTERIHQAGVAQSTATTFESQAEGEEAGRALFDQNDTPTNQRRDISANLDTKPLSKLPHSEVAGPIKSHIEAANRWEREVRAASKEALETMHNVVKHVCKVMRSKESQIQDIANDYRRGAAKLIKQLDHRHTQERIAYVAEFQAVCTDQKRVYDEASKHVATLRRRVLDDRVYNSTLAKMKQRAITRDEALKKAEEELEDLCA
ncbi:hypothetical protein F5Y15DRAFT_190596 [Xylariaceae sp. FL0016]|nr:hypothetical protein F5Y15DRAFT_190596 [Xylariaceae sp. FL0016]